MRLGDAQLVQEHLGALVGMGQLHPGHEPSRRVADIGDEQVMTALAEEPVGRVGACGTVEQGAGLRDLRVIASAEPLDAHP
jgi:hypothetical protein